MPSKLEFLWVLCICTSVRSVRWTSEAIKTGVNCFPEPDVCRNVSELITSKGYPCEDHTVQTKDGFILSIQRIPAGRGAQSCDPRIKKPVVFLQHGLLCSAANWLTNLQNQSLGYILADAGYDVWLGNMRGSTYSRKHVKYRPKDDEFWAWSWDEMAEYDLPAMVDYVLNVTGQEKIHYVAHSQGTLIAFAHMSQHQEFAQKIKLFFALGPVATVAHIESPIRYLKYFAKELADLFNLFGVHEFLPNDAIIKLLASTVCDAATRVFCEDVIFIVAGFDQKQLNESRLPVYLAHSPAGTSVQNMVHFAQMTESGLFQMYDYGSPQKNKLHYGQPTPPIYNPRKVLAPVVAFSAANDWLSDPTDVAWLIPQLPKLVHFEQIPDWDHLDFVWAMDAKSVVYSKILAMMKQFESVGKLTNNS